MATKKPVWALPDGSTVGQKDLGKVKPTPKPIAPKDVPIKKQTKQEYDKQLAKAVAEHNKTFKGKW